MLEFLGSTTTEVMVNLFTAVAAVALIIWALAKGLQERYATAPAYEQPAAERPAGPAYRPEYKIPAEKKPERKALPKISERRGRSIKEILDMFKSEELDELEAELKTKIYQILKEELKAESVGFDAEHQTILEQITEALMMQEAAIVIADSKKFRSGEKNRLAKAARIYTERAKNAYPELDKIREQCKGILEKIRKYMERVMGYDIERLSEKLAGIETERTETTGPEPTGPPPSELPPDITYTPQEEEPGVKTVQATVRDKSAGPGGLPRAGEDSEEITDTLNEIDELLGRLEQDRELAVEILRRTREIQDSERSREEKEAEIERIKSESERRRNFSAQEFREKTAKAEQMIRAVEEKLEQRRVEPLKERLRRVQHFLR